jgi:hypothetical protein
VPARDGVERVARLQRVAAVPAGRVDGARLDRLLDRLRRRTAGDRRARLGTGRRRAGGQHQALARLEGGSVRQAVDLDQRADLHAVPLGDPEQGIARLHLD